MPVTLFLGVPSKICGVSKQLSEMSDTACDDAHDAFA
jgi:hypothetical protein